MAWLLLKFSAPDSYALALADALEACGAHSVTIEGAREEQRLQSGLEETRLWDENRVTGLFPESTDVGGVLAALRDALGAGALPPHRVSFLEDDDWARAWMAHYRPLQVAPGLWVCPSWCTPPDPRAVSLILDPGLAFGTGTHPTTALCLGWLAGQPLAGQTVIDYGCGSGILAIAALKLGAARAVGVDLDPHALQASRENAARNGVAERYEALAPEKLPPDVHADLVAANILAATLIELAPELAARVESGGRIGLSGLLAEQTDDVRRYYAPYFALETQARDGWVLLAGRRT